ncbi:hypothetical protein [Sphingomonas baiyangensis]|uniref:Uncharacterized protein n=1 Tax=Sphingomonas baiyangensis TaxID=2572576 RepID=A0A4U1L9N0_9SPHN|nr:hypothetical protein [Sphingomonas baiyangensis]TKD53036.1 hypothetical protein FBR43_01455 [Sphingomonas baiyangensis]
MFRVLRTTMLIVLPALMLGVPAGFALGGFATGDAAPSYTVAGYMPPDAGAELASASAADAIRPADTAYSPEDRYVQAASSFSY